MSSQDLQKGVSLLEVVIAMAIISMAMVPITSNLTASLKMEVAGNEIMSKYHLVRAKMEEVLNQDFDLLADANGVEIMGENLTWQVQVSDYDGDGDGDDDPDLKFIRLIVGEIELETLRFRNQ